ncbi:MAG TPA: YfhO family protein [Gemmatimonadaceae bacterium]|nr:YfhO family protein [Gemmatimonadaceae bacterium]
MRAASWRERWWTALAFAAATIALGYPALVGRFLVSSHSDQYIAGYPFRELAARWMREGNGMPLWNPYQFGGMPHVAAMHGDLFYPTFLLRLVLPTDLAMTWGFLLHLFLAGVFTYAFLRAIGLGSAAALVGGLAYMLGGNVAGLVSPGHDGKLFIAALLPLTLLLVQRGVRDGRAWAWGALALTVMLAVLTPHPQLLQYLLLVAGAWALFVACSRLKTGEALARSVALRRLAVAGAMVGLGMLGGAVQFWPVLEYAPWSPRAGGRGWEHAVSYSMPPEELFNGYLPQFSGMLDLYAGRNFIHFHSEYLGAAVLLLAGLAFGAAGARRRVIWFWAGALVVATLWALGGFTPFYHLVYAVVPGTKFFRAPSTMLFVVAFSVAVLAAFGAERALSGGASRRYLLAWSAVAFVIAVLATSGALSTVAAAFAPPQRLERVTENAPHLVLGAWRALAVVLATAGVLVALRRGALTARHAGWVLAAVVAFDLWSVARQYWRFAAPAAELYASDPVIEYLKSRPEPGRVVPLAIAPLTGSMRDPYLGWGDGRAAGLMVHGIRSAVGYHGNELGRYDLLIGWDDDWPRQLGNPNLWRLLNVRYLYTNVPEPPLAGMRRVAGPARNAAGSIVYLYELPGDNPLAWVTPLAVRAPDEIVRATVLDPRFDVRRAALFDTSAVVSTRPVPGILPEPLDLPVRVEQYAPGRIVLTLDRPAPANAALVVSENYYPGWRATVDGRAVPVDRANYVLTGVVLPGGARRVELTFMSPRYRTGRTVTLAALLAGTLLLVGGVLRERRTIGSG